MWINLTPDELKSIKTALHSKTCTIRRRLSEHSPIEDELTQRLNAHNKLIAKIIEEEKDSRSPLRKCYRDVALKRHHVDGEIEIDDQSDGTTCVSPSEDGGAYVLAWVWVDDADAGICPECGDFPGSETYGTVGDGYYGLCPSCADKDEKEAVELPVEEKVS